MANGVVYAIGPSGVHAYDAGTGSELTTIAGTFSGEVVVAEGHVLVSCTDATLGRGICVYAP